MLGGTRLGAMSRVDNVLRRGCKAAFELTMRRREAPLSGVCTSSAYINDWLDD